MEKLQRLVQDLLEQIIAQVADDRLPEVSCRVNGPVFRKCLDRSRSNKNHKEGCAAGGRQCELETGKGNGDRRCSGSSEDRIKNQTDEEWRRCFE